MEMKKIKGLRIFFLLNFNKFYFSNFIYIVCFNGISNIMIQTHSYIFVIRYKIIKKISIILKKNQEKMIW